MYKEAVNSPFLEEILQQTLLILSEHDDFDADTLARIVNLVDDGDLNNAEQLIAALCGEAM